MADNNIDLDVEIRLQAGAAIQALNRFTAEAGKADAGTVRASRAAANYALAIDRLASASIKMAKVEVEKSRATNQASQADLNAARAANQRSMAEDRSARATERAHKATMSQSGSTSQLAGNLPRLRYALYDVSSSLAIMGAAMVGASVAAAAVAISMDRAFADVQRTSGATGDAVDVLRGNLESLFATMPASWGAITQIATLAGQLGVAEQNIARFTNLVVKFSATTDVTAEASATAFGRLSALLDVASKDYERLGSSILNVGVNSVATESQIISISSQIASIGSLSGLSADEVFGLSAALASVGTQPELARGTVTRVFTLIESAIADGGDALETFGQVAGVSGQQFAAAWRDNATGALTQFAAGLNELGTGGVTVLKDLGINGVRDIPVMLKLAQNTDLLAKALEDAKVGWDEGSALQDQYSIISSTVAEKITVLVNNFQLLVSSIADSTGALGWLIDGAIGLLGAFNNLVNNPVGSTIFAIVGGMTALGGVVALVTSLMLRFLGSTAAAATALKEFQRSELGAASGGSVLAASLQMVGLSAGRAQTAASLLTTGLKAMSVVSLALVGIQLADWLADGARELSGFKVSLDEVTNLLKGEDFMGALEATIGKSGGFRNTVNSLFGAGQDTSDLLEEAAKIGYDWGAQFNYGMNKAFSDIPLVGGIVDWFEGDADKGIEELDQALADLLNTGDVDAYLTAINGVRGRFKDLGGDVGWLNQQLTKSSEAWHNAVASGTVAEAMEARAQEVKAAAEEIATASDVLDGVGTDAMIGLQESLFALGESLGENGQAFGLYTQAGIANMKALNSVTSAVAEASGNDAALTAANLGALYDYLTKKGLISAEAAMAMKQQIDILTASAGGKSALPMPTFQPINFDAITQGVDSYRAAQEKSTKATEQNTAAEEANKKAKEELQKQIDANSDRMDWLNTQIEKQNKILEQTKRTTQDYADDVSDLFGQFFDFASAGVYALQGIKDAWDNIAQAQQPVEDAMERLKDAQDDLTDARQKYNETVSGLKADRVVLQYQLQVAEKYGDTVRAAELRAQLGENTAKAAQAEKALADAQKEVAKAQRELAAEKQEKKNATNNAALMDVVGSYVDYLGVLTQAGKITGKNSPALKKQIEDFKKQAREAGFSNKQIEEGVSILQQYGAAAGTVPNWEINTGFKYGKSGMLTAKGLQGAMNASLKNWALDNKEFLLQAGWKLPGWAKSYGGNDFQKWWNDQRTAFNRKNQLTGWLNLRRRNDAAFQKYKRELDAFNAVPANKNANINYSSSGSAAPPDLAAQREAAFLKWYNQQPNRELISTRFLTLPKAVQETWDWTKPFAMGGYTGNGGKYEPKGIVHGGEYVVPKHMVNQSTGLPYAGALASLSAGSGGSSYATGGFVGNTGPMMVELSPYDRALLRQAGQNSIVMDTGTLVGQTTRFVASGNRRGY